MLKLKNITFSYQSTTPVIKEFNLSVNTGEVVAIKGPSGCGKSTILRLISGLETLQSGDIYLDDVLINNTPTSKRNVGFVFQSMALFPHLTVRKNIEFGLHNFSKEERKTLVENVAEKVEVSDLLNRYPHEISGGQQQRVAIARSLVVKPKVLLLDEPFTALDADLKEQVRKDIKKILDLFKITTVLVTHDETDAYALDAKIIELKK